MPPVSRDMNATNALAKIAATSPKDLRDAMANTGLWVATAEGAGTVVDVKLVREAIRREQKLQIAYVAETGVPTERHRLRRQREVDGAFGKYRWRGNLARSRKGRLPLLGPTG
jgi:hypothetical protein